MVRGMLVAAVALAGCGVGQTFEGPGGKAVLIGTPTVHERKLLSTTVEKKVPVPEKRTTVRGTFDVKAPRGTDGASLSVMAGFAGCGISVEAIGTATVRDGRAFVRLNAPLAANDVRELFITLDVNRDGRCTEVDTMWTALLPTGQDDLTVALDLEELEATASWMCFGGGED